MAKWYHSIILCSIIFICLSGLELVEDFMKRITCSFGKGVLWASFTLVFGLLQLWVLLARDAVMVIPGFNFNEMLLSGTLLFFTSAVVSAICIDYYLGRSGTMPKIVAGGVYFIYPMLIMFMCAILFMSCFSKDEKTIDIATVENIQFAIVVMTVVYAIVTKTVMFFQEDSE